MRGSNYFTTCGVHGELARDQVKKGGRMPNGNPRFRCLVCSARYQKHSYVFKKHPYLRFIKSHLRFIELWAPDFLKAAVQHYKDVKRKIQHDEDRKETVYKVGDGS